jgi:oxygen-independent coproporphyrinogen-3 oxidase
MGLQKKAVADFCFDSLYIGGGTPSLLSVAEMERILGAAHDNFTIAPDAEITVEANPGTLYGEKLKGYLRAGINRITIGVQSFIDENLSFLGRIHNARQAQEAIIAASQLGFSSIGIDLIYGLPGQDREAWLGELTRAVALGPEHISCYMLTLEEGTPMARDHRMGRFAMPPERETAGLFRATIRFLAENDYCQYETSNFARRTPLDLQMGRDNRSRHNCKYWNNCPYLGLGPSAHSFLSPRRFWNHASVEIYMTAVQAGSLPQAEEEVITAEKALIEGIYLGLRQTQGIHIPTFNAAHRIDFEKRFAAPLKELSGSGMLCVATEWCRLTIKGQCLLDSVTGMLVAEI